MPKVFKCIYCNKGLIGGTYTLIEHVSRCPVHVNVKRGDARVRCKSP